MIGIKVNGEFLDLLPETSINFKFKNPIFAEGNIIPGSYSLPFQVPCEDISPKNDRILDHPGEWMRHSRKKTYKGIILYFDGLQIKKGDLVIDNVSRGIANCSFKFGLTTISEELKTVLVKDIIAEEKILYTPGDYTKKIELTVNEEVVFSPTPGVYTVPSFKLIVNGIDYTVPSLTSGSSHSAISTSLSALKDLINANEEPPLALATHYETGWQGGSTSYIEIEPLSNPTDITTQLEVSQINGNDPLDDVILIMSNANDYMQEIADTVNTYLSNTPPDDKIRFPLFFNRALSPTTWKPRSADEERTRKKPEILYNNQDEEASAVLKTNHYPYNELASNGANTTFYCYNYTSLAPFIKLKYVIDSIVSYFGINLEGDFLESEDYLKALIVPPSTLDAKQLFVGSEEFVFWRPNFNLSELVPEDLKAVDLLKALQTRYSLAIYYDEERRILKINTRQSILLSRSYADLSHLISPIQQTSELGVAGVRLEAEIEDDDKFAVPESLSLEEEELVLPSPISGIQSIKDVPTIPQIDVSGTTKSLRFVFENGVVTETKIINSRSTKTIMYYSATNHLPDHNNTFEGLYPIYWEQYVRWLMRRRRADLSARLGLNEIINIDWEKKYRVAGVKCLYSELDITFTNRGIGPANLILYTTD